MVLLKFLAPSIFALHLVTACLPNGAPCGGANGVCNVNSKCKVVQTSHGQVQRCVRTPNIRYNAQCGGPGYNGQTTCPTGYICKAASTDVMPIKKCRFEVHFLTSNVTLFAANWVLEICLSQVEYRTGRIILNHSGRFLRSVLLI